jgi:NTP pyrophosphatase (non-canonical NTP hydrolase)
MKGATSMRLKDFFDWVNDFNYKRGWDLIPTSMALVHLSEEFGELADVILKYRSGDMDESEARYEVAGEAADAMILVIKLAQVCNVDLLSALAQKGIHQFSSMGSQETDDFLSDLGQQVTQVLQSLGELARHVNFEEKFKDPSKRTNVQRVLVDELALMFELLLGVAGLCRVDVSRVLRGKMAKIAKRFSPEPSLAETKSYLQHAASTTSEALHKFQARFES